MRIGSHVESTSFHLISKLYKVHQAWLSVYSQQTVKRLGWEKCGDSAFLFCRGFARRRHAQWAAKLLVFGRREREALIAWAPVGRIPSDWRRISCSGDAARAKLFPGAVIFFQNGGIYHSSDGGVLIIRRGGEMGRAEESDGLEKLSPGISINSVSESVWWLEH